MDEVEKWLNDAECIVIGCQENTAIDKHTLVVVTPIYNKGENGSAKGQREMLLKEAIKIKKKQIAKGEKLINYLKTNLKEVNSW